MDECFITNAFITVKPLNHDQKKVFIVNVCVCVCVRPRANDI